MTAGSYAQSIALPMATLQSVGRTTAHRFSCGARESSWEIVLEFIIPTLGPFLYLLVLEAKLLGGRSLISLLIYRGLGLTYLKPESLFQGSYYTSALPYHWE